MRKPDNLPKSLGDVNGGSFSPATTIILNFGALLNSGTLDWVPGLTRPVGRGDVPNAFLLLLVPANAGYFG